MRSARTQQPDFIYSNHGSVSLLRPMTDAARDWLAENVSQDAQWFGGALAIEWRYVDSLLEGVVQDGLHVANTSSGFH